MTTVFAPNNEQAGIVINVLLTSIRSSPLNPRKAFADVGPRELAVVVAAALAVYGDPDVKAAAKRHAPFVPAEDFKGQISREGVQHLSEIPRLQQLKLGLEALLRQSLTQHKQGWGAHIDWAAWWLGDMPEPEAP